MKMPFKVMTSQRQMCKNKIVGPKPNKNEFLEFLDSFCKLELGKRHTTFLKFT